MEVIFMAFLWFVFMISLSLSLFAAQLTSSTFTFVALNAQADTLKSWFISEHSIILSLSYDRMTGTGNWN